MFVLELELGYYHIDIKAIKIYWSKDIFDSIQCSIIPFL